MSERLTTAIDIADSATAILQRVEIFDWMEHQEKEGWDLKAHIGIDPMLLGLAMELALKAWYVFDHDKGTRGHKLSELFGKLKPESQNWLDTEFRQSVAPSHPNLFHLDYGIDNVLFQHEDAFTDWRYMHDLKKTAISFEQSVFVATLTMVLAEFRKRYRTIQYSPPNKFR